MSELIELYGRKDIYSPVEEINEKNIISVVNNALSYHNVNLLQEEELYWYKRGVQPILNRTKERNSYINNKVVENHADEIVAFKNGYFLTQPCFYISRNNKSQNKVDKLNEYLYRSGKHGVDNDIVDWFHTVGKAALYVEPGTDDETPIKAYALDPRSAFVVYSLRPGKEPLLGINMVVVGNAIKVDAFTKDSVYRLSGSAAGKFVTDDPSYICTVHSLEKTEPNILGHIPIIEYRYSSDNKASFEAVIPLLNTINKLQSNRIDGVEQFIQSIAIATNCEFEEGVTAESIKKAGILCLRSTSEQRADFTILSQQLDQTQTQTFVDYLYEQVLSICAMPSTTKGGTSTSDTGAAVLARDGWYQADASARNTEDLFKRSNRYFDEILIDVLDRKGLLKLKISDFELNFVRNETANVYSKSQSLQNLLSAGMSPELAFAKSGISNDPVSDVKASEKYLKMVWGDPDKEEEPTINNNEGAIINEERSTEERNAQEGNEEDRTEEIG